MIKNGSLFKNVYALKILVALSSESLKPVPLLYKVCLADLVDKYSVGSIRNINSFVFYLKGYRETLQKLYDLYLIAINGEQLCITFDGASIIDNLLTIDTIQSFKQSCFLIEEKKNSSTYQELYMTEVERFTKSFLGGDNL